MNSNKGKISILLPSLGGGGAEKVMVTLANYFVENSYEVDLLLVSNQGNYFNRLSSKVRIIDLNSSRALFAIPKILKYLKTTPTNVLLSALTHINIVALLSKLLSRRSIRVVISERSIISKNFLSSQKTLLKIAKPLLRFLYPMADSIIAISNGVATDLASTINIPKKQINVIYNPLTINSVFDGSEKIIPQIVELKRKSNTPILISVGRLDPEKNYKLLIKAFSLLRQKREVSLIILGEGQQRLMIEDLMSKYKLEQDVFLFGFVNNPISFLANSDVFVLSSNWEGFGNVLLEAMSVGLKIVSTDCPSGPREILEDGRWGKLVPVDNAEKLASAIDEILDEDIQYDVRERVKSFSVGKVAQKYLEVMNL